MQICNSVLYSPVAGSHSELQLFAWNSGTPGDSGTRPWLEPGPGFLEPWTSLDLGPSWIALIAPFLGTLSRPLIRLELHWIARIACRIRQSSALENRWTLPTHSTASIAVCHKVPHCPLSLSLSLSLSLFFLFFGCFFFYFYFFRSFSFIAASACVSLGIQLDWTSFLSWAPTPQQKQKAKTKQNKNTHTQP